MNIVHPPSHYFQFQSNLHTVNSVNCSDETIIVNPSQSTHHQFIVCIAHHNHSNIIIIFTTDYHQGCWWSKSFISLRAQSNSRLSSIQIPLQCNCGSEKHSPLVLHLCPKILLHLCWEILLHLGWEISSHLWQEISLHLGWEILLHLCC